MRHVIATAGHVDHGKSTLVRALTGMEPDRFAEERRRGMTIDLGYAWTTLPTGQQLAFVDVPGHQRFIANMLAGLGPAPAVLFVVAADEGWSRQSDEHLAAVNALRVRHGVLAITRSDLADPARALAHARNVLRGSSLGDVEAVAVSGVTGAGLDPLRSALARLADRLPAPDSTAPVRFWIDRSFTIRGSGTVVTGTLSSGLIALGDVLILRDRMVTVRSIQSAGVPVDSVRPVSRVAVNLRAVTTAQIGRGDVLLTPDRFHLTSVVDVQLEAGERMLAEVVLHVGTAAVPARIRPLGRDFARLTMLRPLPLRAGDRTVLRDPGRQSVAAGALVLDADPPDLRRRGAARARADVLTTATVPPDPGVELARRGAVRRHDLDRLGVDTADLPGTGAWLVSAPQRAAWLERMPAVVDDWAREHPLDPPIPRGALRQALAVPDDALLDGVVAQAGLSIVAGRVGPVRAPSSLGPAEAGVTRLLARLAERPFDAPGQDELRDLGLGRREVAAAVRAGRLVQLAEGVVLLPDAPERAAAVLAELDAPFTLSAARQALRTTRRTAVPLLEHLDSLGLTERDSSFTRRVRL